MEELKHVDIVVCPNYAQKTMGKWLIIISAFLALALWGCGDEASSERSAQNTNTATLSWNPNAEEDLAGYYVYYGTTSANYSTVVDVGLTSTPDAPEYTVTDLEQGVFYYFAATAYDTFDNESDFSDEVSKEISG